MRNLCIFSIGLLAICMSTACDQLEKKKEDEAKSEATELEGTWTRGCTAYVESSSETDSIYSIQEWVFQGNLVSSSKSNYSDSGCTTKLSSTRYSGTHKIGVAVATPSGAKLHEVTSNGEIFHTFNDPDMVSTLNAEGSCGGGWEVNKEKKISIAVCPDLAQMNASDYTWYNIFKIESGNLYQGSWSKENDGSTAEKAPKELDKTPFTRK